MPESRESKQKNEYPPSITSSPPGISRRYSWFCPRVFRFLLPLLPSICRAPSQTKRCFKNSDLFIYFVVAEIQFPVLLSWAFLNLSWFFLSRINILFISSTDWPLFICSWSQSHLDLFFFGYLGIFFCFYFQNASVSSYRVLLLEVKCNVSVLCIGFMLWPAEQILLACLFFNFLNLICFVGCSTGCCWHCPDCWDLT